MGALVGLHWQVPELINRFSGPLSELYWFFPPQKLKLLVGKKAAKLPRTTSSANLKSQAFAQGGFYIMQNACDHIFIDCGPIGLGGRGGHGHNDCLSFEAMLDRELLISDCGAYLYTASYHERNWFRSTAYHNTPQIDGEEINRFVSWDNLWTFHQDSIPGIIKWFSSELFDEFCGSHTGYQRLANPLQLKRTIILQHQTHSLTIKDEFIGSGTHRLTIPLHLAIGVKADIIHPGKILLQTSRKQFLLSWVSAADWNLELMAARISPSYGVVKPSEKLIWQRTGQAANLEISIKPC